MSAWNPRANAIFLKAVELSSPAERKACVEEECAGDAALRDQVEALLGAIERAGSFLESPAPAPTLTHGSGPLTEGPGTVIGPYRLLESIGEGGMGVVYMAEQTRPVRRKVALKIIKPGMDSKQVVARFEVERQALALMDHPSIAKVLDAGATESGRPYFVMELVRGVPITDYCDRNRLSINDRLNLFALVCQAVQHAHQKGIIHRDIKPSNVLITLHDGAPVPKVIDFGIAKATGQSLTDKTLFTGFAQLVGTPLYMSPEQAELSGIDVDTRSDIYSLGVLLYELLTGTTPFDQDTFRTAALGEVCRILRELEPPTPSTRLSALGATGTTVSANRRTDPRKLSNSLRGELDWIVMKALEKDRRRRYETASAFAADIRRYLDGDPVEAGPPSRVYRLRKFVRKHRAGLAAVTAVVLALVVAVSALAVSTVVISRGRTEALRKLAQVRAERRDLARVYFRQNALVGKALSDIKNKSFDREAWAKAEFEMVDEAVQFQDLLARQLLSDPEARYEAAFCYYKSGDNEAGLSRDDPSAEGRRQRAEHVEVSQRKAVALLTQLLAEAPGRRDYAEGLQAALSHLGLHLYVERRRPEAEAVFRQALAIDDEVTSGHLAAPEGWQPWPAGRMYAGRGIRVLALLVARDRPEAAEALFRRSVARLEEWSREYPPDAKGLRREIVASRHDLIITLKRLGKKEEAAREVSELAREPTDDPGLCNDLAWLLATAEEPRDRDPARALALARTATAKAPQNPNHWNTLGVALYRAGDWKAAIEALAKSRGMRAGGDPFDWFFLAMAYWQLGDKKEARSWYDKSVGWMDQKRSKDEELIRFRAEAEALLRMEDSHAMMPHGEGAFAR